MARLQNSSQCLTRFRNGIFSLYVAFCLRGRLYGRGLLGGFGRSVAFSRRRLDLLFLLRARSDRRRLAVGQDLGDADHGDLVTVTTLALRILAAALLEGNNLRAALVVEHFRRDRCTRNEGNTEHRRDTTDHQNFTTLHDRADITGDLANLKHIIWDDPELPAARFDDCEHRYIPSCSIPALGQVRAGFLFSRYGFIAEAGGASRPRSRKNKLR